MYGKSKNYIIEWQTVKSTLKAGLASRFFPFVTAAVLLLCYYLGWDIIAIYYLTLTGALICAFCDDLTPLITVFLFLGVMVSAKNSPSMSTGSSPYYFKPAILAQIIIVAALFIGACIYRLVLTAKSNRFKVDPIFIGLCVFAAVLLLNGVFYGHYTFMNMVFGGLLAFCFLFVYALLKDNLGDRDKLLEKISFSFLGLSVLLLVELVVLYLTKDELIVDGQVIREVLVFGWGIHNTMAILLLMCVPFVMYLASRYKYGFLLTVYSLVLSVGIIMTMSRQSMLGIIAVYPLSFALLMIKCKNRKPHIIVLAAAACAVLAFAAVFWQKLAYSFANMFDHIFENGQLSGSGRMGIYENAVRDFETSPLTGIGFFGNTLEGVDWIVNASGLNFIPFMYHNTIMQMLASCGIIGLMAYAVHRTQSIICFFNNITVERCYMALVVAVIVGLSLIDVHIIDIFGTINYSFLLAALYATEGKTKDIC